MWHHPFSHLLSRQVEHIVDKWVEAGQNVAPISVGDMTCELKYSGRRRLNALIPFAEFVFMVAIFLVLLRVQNPMGVAEAALYIALLLALLIISAWCWLSVWTTRIRLSHEGILFQRYGYDSPLLRWESIEEVTRTPVSGDLLLTSSDGTRHRISTQLDGVEALVHYFNHLAPGRMRLPAIQWLMEMMSREPFSLEQ